MELQRVQSTTSSEIIYFCNSEWIVNNYLPYCDHEYIIETEGYQNLLWN